MDFPGMELSESDGHVFLSVAPAAARNVLEVGALRDWLEERGYGQWLLHPDALEHAVRSGNAGESRTVLLVAQRCDARVNVQIASDAMSAAVQIAPPQGGREASAQDVLNALAQAGVTHGIDLLAVAQALAGGSEGVAVAHGVPPEDGCDAVFEELIPAAPQRVPLVDAQGRIDYRERDSIAMVHAGAWLMRRIPPTPGVAGYSVRGEALPARAGRDAAFAAQMAGAEVSEENPDVLQACLSGQAIRMPNGVMVEPVLRVAQVDMATGNIHYEGTVQIDGDVYQEMKVHASGDIVVGGTVDGGWLRSGGDIRVAGGVIANAKLHAEGAVSARFAENSQLWSGTVLTLHDSALECELQSLHEIAVGGRAPRRGRLIGGRATAMMLVQTPVLGSAAGGVTRLVLGANPVLEERLRVLLQRLEQEAAVLANLHKLVAHLTAQGDPQGLLGRAQASLDKALAEHTQSQAQCAELQAQQALARQARVQVGVAVEGAVDLVFGRLSLALRREWGRGSFQQNGDGAVVFVDPQGFADPVLPMR